jgi:hypothetical protein
MDYENSEHDDCCSDRPVVKKVCSVLLRDDRRNRAAISRYLMYLINLTSRGVQSRPHSSVRVLLRNPNGEDGGNCIEDSVNSSTKTLAKGLSRPRTNIVEFIAKK